MRTALVYSEKYLEHNPGLGHPERPERLKAIVNGLKRFNLWQTPEIGVIEPRPAKPEDIKLVHDPEYVSLVEKMSAMERPIDGDTPTKKNTFELALLAAGGAIDAGTIVMSGRVKNAFALVRPPGHHAGRSRGGGFCYFNNVAIMIERLKRDFKLKRFFVLDFDAHHGNGTQEIFYDDPSVLYMSLHQHPLTLYPGTGFPDEIGEGKGRGLKVNVPMPPGSGDAEYWGAMREIFIPLCEKFKPEFFAVSAGFDAHFDDPLTGLHLSTQAYGWLSSTVIDQAEKWCKGRVVFLLEGGYDLEALASGAVYVVRAMQGEKFATPEVRNHLKVIDEVKMALSEKWSL
ncbi:MAG: histone deacetylase family protein [Candidatus Hadarchaeum sp.]|uniref:histone deacetylase family protein n=1 Tax=Candidatus Hadarchaeum sp. TaxID=2883567 RepID=UPI003D0CB6D0